MRAGRARKFRGNGAVRRECSAPGSSATRSFVGSVASLPRSSGGKAIETQPKGIPRPHAAQIFITPIWLPISLHIVPWGLVFRGPGILRRDRLYRRGCPEDRWKSLPAFWLCTPGSALRTAPAPARPHKKKGGPERSPPDAERRHCAAGDAIAAIVEPAPVGGPIAAAPAIGSYSRRR